MLSIAFVLMFLLLLMGFPMMVPLLIGALAMMFMLLPGIDPTSLVRAMISGQMASVPMRPFGPCCSWEPMGMMMSVLPWR